jgi:hypothetical protein
MKRSLLVVWILFPIGVAAWHFGAGETHLARDRADNCVRQAEAAESAQQWGSAARFYQSAREALPEDDPGRDAIEMAEARTRINAGEMIEGQEQIERLLTKLEGDSQASRPLIDQATDELARSSYYAAWIMRLEGAAPDEWKPEAERARQQFRLLAERAENGKSPDAELFKRNLEATIRLEQMDMSALLAKPLPKKCCNCKSLSQRKRKQCQAQCKGGGKKEDKQDVRKVIKQQQTGAGVNRREGTGS